MSCFEEETYQDMMNMAQKADKPLKFPDRKLVRKEILSMFNERMAALKKRLHV
jgi:hypothetical protein